MRGNRQSREAVKATSRMANRQRKEVASVTYLSNRQGKQEWQQHEESERGCFCWSGKDAK